MCFEGGETYRSRKGEKSVLRRLTLLMTALLANRSWVVNISAIIISGACA
jgi:hypothetical protein